MTKTDVISTEFFTVTPIAKNILENIVHENVQVDIDQVLAMKKANEQLTNDEPYCVLVNSKIMSSITEDARKLTASKEFQKNTVAKALLVDSVGHRLVANFYIKVNKPHISTKVFNDRTKAIDWLTQKLKIN